jgi:hypothetical protein
MMKHFCFIKLIVQMQRQVQATPRGYFGFDNIEIYRLPSEPEPEETTRSSSQTTPIETVN